MDRRRFFRALAAIAVVPTLPLPTLLPKSAPSGLAGAFLSSGPAGPQWLHYVNGQWVPASPVAFRAGRRSGKTMFLASQMEAHIMKLRDTGVIVRYG